MRFRAAAAINYPVGVNPWGTFTQWGRERIEVTRDFIASLRQPRVLAATVTRTAVTNVDRTTAASHAISGVTITAGDLGVLRFGYRSDSVTITSVTDDAGNTWSVAISGHSSSGDAQTGAVAFLVVPGGGLSGATVTIALSATSALWGDLCSFNSDIGWPSQSVVLDATSVNNTGITVNWTSNATGTTTQADELLVGAAYAASAIDSATLSTPSGSWTGERDVALSNAGFRLVTQWQQVAATGAYACNGTWNGTGEIAVCTIATFRIGSDSTAPPSVAGVAESATTTAGTSHTINLPASIVAGETLLVISDKGSTAATIDALTGWTELIDENSANGLYAIWRKADGTEGATITLTSSAATRLASIAYRVQNAADPSVTAPEIATTGSGTSATPDPPSLSPSGGSKQYLWIAWAGMAGEEADDDTWGNTSPASYSPSVPRQKACGTVGTNLGGKILSAERLNTTATEDPGTFGVDVSAAWRSQTIAISPQPAAAPSGGWVFRRRDRQQGALVQL